ncbi:MAG: dipeptidase [Firmicutes bacterium]|nr:dipeptidase [Bacillota bacterium]
MEKFFIFDLHTDLLTFDFGNRKGKGGGDDETGVINDVINNEMKDGILSGNAGGDDDETGVINDVINNKAIEGILSDYADGGIAAVCAVWVSKSKNPIGLLRRAKRFNALKAIEDLGFLAKFDFGDLAKFDFGGGLGFDKTGGRVFELDKLNSDKLNSDKLISDSPILDKLNSDGLNFTLKQIRDFDPIYASLTWNDQNGLAGGACSDGGLEVKGKRVIDFLVENGIAVDLAHLNRESFFAVLEYINCAFGDSFAPGTNSAFDTNSALGAKSALGKNSVPGTNPVLGTNSALTKNSLSDINFAFNASPTLGKSPALGIKSALGTSPAKIKPKILCSHTCFSDIFNHSRNICKDQIKAIIEAGGIIGLTFVAEFMGKKQATIFDIVAQIEYFLTHFDPKFLSLGSDFFGCDNLAVNNYADLFLIKNHLFKQGVIEQAIDDIFFTNAYSFFLDEKNR